MYSKRIAQANREIQNTAIRREIEEQGARPKQKPGKGKDSRSEAAKAENREVVAPTKKAITKNSTDSEILELNARSS
jgi:hypothetical protein